MSFPPQGAGGAKLYALQVALGMVPYAVVGSITGINDFIPTTPLIVLSNVTSASFPINHPGSPIQMQLISDSSNDIANTGTGAQEVEITYVTLPFPSNVVNPFQKKTETVLLNGTNPVITTNTDIFAVDRIRVSKVGTLSHSDGNIYLQSVGGGVTYEKIDANSNEGATCIHWVPKGHRSIVTGASFGTTTSGGIRFILFKTEFDSVGNSVNVTQLEVEFSNGSFKKSIDSPIVVNNPEGRLTSIGVLVIGKSANQSGNATIEFIDEMIDS